MLTSGKALIDLETKFWQSMVDQDPEVAVQMLNEPALMVSSHGAMKFDHAGYRKMAEQGPSVLTAFELRDVDVTFPSEEMAIITYGVKQTVAPRKGSSGTTREMFDTSTWIRRGNGWRCIMHTETPKDINHATN